MKQIFYSDYKNTRKVINWNT